MNDAVAEANAKKGVVAVIGAAALTITTPLLMTWEGKRNDPYLDLVNVPTVCWGDTNNVRMGQRQTDQQCLIRLYKQIEQHAKPVVACVPQLRGRPYQLSASVSLAYNIGVNGFCKSTAARRFRAGDWKGGCNAFAMWNKAGGRIVKGLVNRRYDEMRICLTGLP